MATSVVLLRGVNVGGHNRVSMADFKAVLADLGATRTDTYVNSGNAVVDLPAKGLATKVTSALDSQLGLTVGVVVVSASDLGAIWAANPYPELAQTPKQLHVVFCDAPVTAASVAAARTGLVDDDLHEGKNCIYVRYATMSHNSPLVPVLKKWPGVTTARNWTTVTALHEMC